MTLRIAGSMAGLRLEKALNRQHEEPRAADAHLDGLARQAAAGNGIACNGGMALIHKKTRADEAISDSTYWALAAFVFAG